METTSSTATPRSDDNFEDAAAIVRRNFTRAANRPLFRVEAADLFPLYLAGFAPADRQQHNCNACRHFIERFGNLVTIEPDGTTRSAMWSDDAPEPYRASISALRSAVEHRAVTGVFYSAEKGLGTVEWTSAWKHFVVENPSVFSSPLKTPTQASAERREELGMLARGLSEFPRTVVEQAVAILSGEMLYRGEKVLGAARWLLAVHDQLASTRNTRHRDNLLWLAVATAPPGFAHVRSTMIGTLLEDLAAGLEIESVKRRFAEKMHPLQYQRPTAPPSEGNIQQAEGVIAKLKTAGALDRRFAKLEDLQALWRPRVETAPVEPTGGVFAHLRPVGCASTARTMDAAPTVITWEKFARTVLIAAERIEYMTTANLEAFLAFVTAANPDAPPILQWDREENRNPVSWYVYSGGSTALRWNLHEGVPVPVTAISLSPPQWDAQYPMPHQGAMVVFVLEGCRDLNYVRSGGFFPESLRAEYHPIRRTMEAYAQQATIAGKEEATACGIALQQAVGRSSLVFWVTAGGVRMAYRIDRWD